MYKYEFDKDNCWYKTICKKFNTENCNENCLQYIEMHYLINKSGIPKARQQINKIKPSQEDIESFKLLGNIKANIYDFVQNGDSLYIFSENFGNGKTTWAIKLLQSYFNKIWNGNAVTPRGLFIHTPSFILKCKKMLACDTIELEEIQRLIPEVDLVVWDDIGATKLTEFDDLMLLAYIDQRLLNKKSNIFTGNLNEKELIDALGNRLKSRIWDNCKVIELKGPNKRNG